MKLYNTIGIIRMRKSWLLACQMLTIMLSFPAWTQAQTVRNPFDFPILLSGNFGELRGNHFHSGLDFKTKGVSGKPIHAVADGFISRVSVSAWGYGNALYMDHPNGTTTVYAHMLRFAPAVEHFVRSEQYRLEQFAVNVFPPKDSLRFKQGDIIGWSGNTGSSAGPHLHFEMRTTATERTFDALPYYKDQIRDTRPPRIRTAALFPVRDKGIANGSTAKRKLKVITTKEGKQTVSGRIEAWGEIGFGIEAYDSMDGTSNIYGVRKLTLTADDDFLFGYEADSFSFAETRYINSFMDYAWWKNERRYLMKSFVEPGNRLSFVRSHGRGILKIDEERPYHLRYTLADLYGNQTELTILVHGKKQPLPAPDTLQHAQHLSWNSENSFGDKGIRLWIPQGSLYADLPFKHSTRTEKPYHSAVYRVHDEPIALHTPGTISLKVQEKDPIQAHQYGIVMIGRRNSRQWIGGTMDKGWLTAPLKELGQSYAVLADSVPPRITPLGTKDWKRSQKLRFRLTDNLSGVLTFRGEIDGEYVLFEMDSRSVITYTMDRSRLKAGKHRLTLQAKDAAGNTTQTNINIQF